MDDLKALVAEWRQRAKDFNVCAPDYDETLKCADELEAALSRPAGGEWVMVPRESTDAMHRAYTECKYNHSRTSPVLISELWRAMLAAAPTPHGGEDAVTGHECYSNDYGDTWFDCPDDAEFVSGRSVGDIYELTVSRYLGERKYRVTKVPDDENDDYEVEPVAAIAASREVV